MEMVSPAVAWCIVSTDETMVALMVTMQAVCVGGCLGIVVTLVLVARLRDSVGGAVVWVGVTEVGSVLRQGSVDD